VAGIALWFWCAIASAAEPGTPKVQAAPGQRLPGEYFGFEPVVAVDGAGQIVVAAIDGHGIFIWTSADSGKTFGPPRPALRAEEKFRHQADPCIQAVGTGRFLLTLMATRPSVGPGNFAYLLRSDDGGRTWKSRQKISADKFDVDRPIFAVSPNGRRAAAVFSGGGPSPLQVLFSTDGAATWTVAPTPLVRPKTGANPYAIVIDDTGRTIVSYSYIERKHMMYRLELGTTEDGGKTWQRHDLGRLADKDDSRPQEESAAVQMWATAAALARDGAGTVHALSAQRADKGEQVDVWYRQSKDGKEWSKPVELSRSRAEVKAYPALAAAGTRVHAIWIESAEGWCQVWYRGSADGGKTWSDRVAVSRPGQATKLMTENGFRSYSGHYMGIAEDGRGTAHVVWAVSEPGLPQSKKAEVWHTTVRLANKDGQAPGKLGAKRSPGLKGVRWRSTFAVPARDTPPG
jgi:photosystem II stability/assembly factor-like uncharacterized protein